jgi:hypothetical protein
MLNWQYYVVHWYQQQSLKFNYPAIEKIMDNYFDISLTSFLYYFQMILAFFNTPIIFIRCLCYLMVKILLCWNMSQYFVSLTSYILFYIPYQHSIINYLIRAFSCLFLCRLYQMLSVFSAPLSTFYMLILQITQTNK